MKAGKYRHYFFGIKKKAILTISLIFGIVFFLTYLGINRIVKKNTLEFLTDQYTYLNDKILDAFGNVYDELDELSGNFITNEYVQKTLTNQEISAADKEMLEKTLSYYNKSFLDSYAVLDNKGNLYSPKSVELDKETFQNSTLYKSLGDEYSKTRLVWTRDVIFGTNEMSFFTVRYIHEMNSDHEAGVLILKLNDRIMEAVRENVTDKELAYFILDANKEICFHSVPKEMESDWQQKLEGVWNQELDESAQSLRDGIISGKTDEQTGYSVLTYAPGSVTNQIIFQIQCVMALTFGLAYLLTMAGVFMFAKKLTEPIQVLSTTMREFDDSKLEERLTMDTNTELDYIGGGYNKMLDKVKQLMSDVQKKEKALKDSEMQTMLYQIRPHFLYNTLDTIYMLARIQKEETIMKMTQSLSKFLRINLSNGKESIEVQEEMEHVSSYLEIQKIRNADLFEYKIEMQAGTEHILVTKMILQPVVENSIKHGFREIYDGGMIWIKSSMEGGYLCLSVENNGMTIAEEELGKLNQLETVSMDEVDQVIQKRKGGFGICNVVKRLRLRYNEEIRFYYVAKEEGTECVIKIKLDEEVEG